MDTLDTQDHCNLYLRGDTGPLPVALTEEQIAARLYGVECEMDRGGFVRLPCWPCGKEALIRPDAVAAIIPECDCDD